jgi:hypothetical protein
MHVQRNDGLRVPVQVATAENLDISMIRISTDTKINVVVKPIGLSIAKDSLEQGCSSQ